jgi:carbamoylphosphate synthase small subunit
LEADTLAAVSAADQLPGLDDVELRKLEAAVRDEYARRHQLTRQGEQEAMERERNEMSAMRAEMEREREAAIREREAEREAQEEAMECEMCMEREKNIVFQCGTLLCCMLPF